MSCATSDSIVVGQSLRNRKIEASVSVSRFLSQSEQEFRDEIKYGSRRKFLPQRRAYLQGSVGFSGKS